MRRTILYIDAMIMPNGNAAAQRASAICQSLIDLGYQPVVVGLDNDLSDNIKVIDTKKTWNGIDCYAVAYPKTVKQWINRMVTIKPFIEVMKNYGIENIIGLIAMDYESISLLRLKKYCKKYDIKLIVDSVEWYGKSHLKFPKNIVKNFDTTIRMKFIYPKMENMICISRYLFNYYSQSVKNICMIPGTIIPNNPKWNLIEYKENEELTLSYAGNPGDLFQKERLDWLIRAIYEMNLKGINCKLLACGFDKKIIIKNFKDISNTKIFKNKIHCYGLLSHNECLEIVAKSDFSVIIRENSRVTNAGFPTKLSESLGCKTPVITTKTSNIDEYIEEGQNGFFIEDFSYESLKETLIKVSYLTTQEKMRMHQTLKNNLIYSQFTDEIKKIIE